MNVNDKVRKSLSNAAILRRFFVFAFFASLIVLIIAHNADSAQNYAEYTSKTAFYVALTALLSSFLIVFFIIPAKRGGFMFPMDRKIKWLFNGDYSGVKPYQVVEFSVWAHTTLKVKDRKTLEEIQEYNKKAALSAVKFSTLTFFIAATVASFLFALAIVFSGLLFENSLSLISIFAVINFTFFAPIILYSIVTGLIDSGVSQLWYTFDNNKYDRVAPNGFSGTYFMDIDYFFENVEDLKEFKDARDLDKAVEKAIKSEATGHKVEKILTGLYDISSLALSSNEKLEAERKLFKELVVTVKENYNDQFLSEQIVKDALEDY